LNERGRETTAARRRGEIYAVLLIPPYVGRSSKQKAMEIKEGRGKTGTRTRGRVRAPGTSKDRAPDSVIARSPPQPQAQAGRQVPAGRGLLDDSWTPGSRRFYASSPCRLARARGDGRRTGPRPQRRGGARTGRVPSSEMNRSTVTRASSATITGRVRVTGPRRQRAPRSCPAAARRSTCVTCRAWPKGRHRCAPVITSHACLPDD